MTSDFVISSLCGAEIKRHTGLVNDDAIEVCALYLESLHRAGVGFTNYGDLANDLRSLKHDRAHTFAGKK